MKLFSHEMYLSRMILKSATHSVIEEGADVKVGSNKVASPLKLDSDEGGGRRG